MRFTMLRTSLRLLFCAACLASPAFAQGTGEAPRNILWDGGFRVGFGNGFWTTQLGNRGPSRRDSWSEEGMNLQDDVCSRVYALDEGTWSLCAWVKRNPRAAEEAAFVAMELTNLNYYGDKEMKNAFLKKFEVPMGNEWKRVGWSFEIKAPVRNHFHVELRGGAGVLVRQASLTRGGTLPEKVLPASDVEAGFDIPEETRIYMDGEERVVDLVATCAAAPAKAKVRWEVFNHREEAVKEGIAEFDFPAGKTTLRQRLPLKDLPWGGYRLASSVEGQAVLGDALVAFLPKIDPLAPPFYGADANVTMRAQPFTPRLMGRLGMRTVNALSCSGGLCRWTICNPEKETYRWDDEAVRLSHEAGLQVILEPMVFKSPPAWVQARFMGKGEIVDEKGFTEAASTYLDTMIRHYGNKVEGVILDDEVNTFAHSGNMDQFRRVYSSLWVAARKAAAAIGKPDMPVGINSTQPDWWQSFAKGVPPEQLATVSANTNLRPERAAEVLNILRQMGIHPGEYRTIGVGQKSRMRATSLFLDRSAGGGAAPGLFSWQLLAHSWLNRPWGTEAVKDGPIVDYGYYDMRTLAQSAYMPQAGKSGVEHDNSPTVGIQAMAMLKHQLQGMRPARDPSKPYAVEGLPTGTPRFFAYPFRNQDRAVIVLAIADSLDLDAAWKLSGMNFGQWKPFDLYEQPLPLRGDGSIEVKDVPLFLRAEAKDLGAALKDLASLKAEMPPRSDKHRLEVGNFILEIDPAREGWFSLGRKQGDRQVVILDRISGLPALAKPSVEVAEGRTSASATLCFGDAKRGPQLAFNLTPESCMITWAQPNGRATEVKQTVRLRLSIEGAGRALVIQEGGKVRSGKMREDYGEFFPDGREIPPATLPDGASRVEVKDFATFDLPGATGVGHTPKTGFLWKTQDGEACLQAAYTLGPITGPRSRGVQKIQLQVIVR